MPRYRRSSCEALLPPCAQAAGQTRWSRVRTAIGRSRRLAFGGLLALALPAMLLPAADSPLTTRPAGEVRSAAGGASTRPGRRPEDIDRVMAFFRDTQPDVYEQAKILRLEDPKKFDTLIGGAIMTVNRLENMKRRNPKLFDLSMRDFQLGYETLRKAHELKRNDLSENDRKQLRAQLAAIVAEQYGVQQQVRQLELEELRQKLKALDQQLQDRQKDKDDIIRKRINDLLERSPGLAW